MRDISDILTVSFDSGLKDEAALCVTRKRDGDYSIIKMELGEQADILYYLLTNQIAKAEIKTEKWIPVSERLPDGQTEVIVSILDNSGDTAFDYTSSGWVTTDGEYWIVDNEICNYVIAWMPLPEPYKEKEEG